MTGVRRPGPHDLGVVTAETFGRDVVGPVVAEFCLRLWTLTEQLEHPEEAVLLFCARGGLRMQLVYERFLAATGLVSAVPYRPLMVSRLAAARPVLVRTAREGLDGLLPSVTAALSREFATSSLGDVVRAVSGVDPTTLSDSSSQAAALASRFTPQALAELLRSPAGGPVVEAIGHQADLFARHLQGQLDGRSHAVLVDTGLYGTTRDLLAEAGISATVSCALIARSFRPGTAEDHRTFGLSVTARDYSPLNRRTALLRYWHYVEWLFEPRLPSASTFHVDGGAVVSDLEVPGWQERVFPDAGTAFAGVLAHLDSLPDRPAAAVVLEADRAWSQLHRAIVLPRPDHGRALSVDERSHGFGREETWEQAEARGLWKVLRSDAMWREGEIARSGTPLRSPVLAAMTAVYAARTAARTLRRRLR